MRDSAKLFSATIYLTPIAVELLLVTACVVSYLRPLESPRYFHHTHLELFSSHGAFGLARVIDRDDALTGLRGPAGSYVYTPYWGGLAAVRVGWKGGGPYGYTEYTVWQVHWLVPQLAIILLMVPVVFWRFIRRRGRRASSE